MKKKLLFLTFFATLVIYSQQKQFQIVWEGEKVLSAGSYSVIVPSFNEANFNYSDTEGLQYISQWKINQAVDASSVNVENVTYANISRSELKNVNIETIPTKLTYSLKTSLARDQMFAYFILSPIIKDANGTFKKVTSFSISYSNGRLPTNRNQNQRVITNSVLSTGQWYKFQVEATGVYKITKDFLSQMGINIDNVDPRTLKIYGNGGNMIPYSNSIDYPIDVKENAIRVIGESDGVFHDSDYILFYAQGPHEFNEDSNSNINCYTDLTYYYINISPGNGKRIQPFLQPSGPVDLSIDTFQQYKYHEVDEYNLVSVGRRWFGDKFDVEDTKTFDFTFPDLVVSEPVNLKVFLGGTSETPTTMNVNVNSDNIATLPIPAITDSNLATEASYNNFITVNSSNLTVTLTYNNGGNPSALAYVDYISLEATRALNFSGEQFTFKNKAVTSMSGIGQYNVSNTSQVEEIWHVTDIYNVTNLVNTDNSSNLSFTSALGTLKSYAIVTPLNYYQPILSSNSTVYNQNIKGTIFQDPLGQSMDVDYLIITPTSLLGQAERLAQINRINNNLNVKVVTLKDIYTEFSTGNQDIGAIRNFVKYVYDNATTPEKRLKYVCLFGDGSFDYKDRIPNNTNLVPSWHAYNSFNLTNSFISDDFYGMMDFNEGNMEISDKLDIAVGRILAENYQSATELVDKIERYYIDASYGSWRNNFVVISDDVDETWEQSLQATTDHIGNVVAAEKPFINVTKIHTDAFQQESSAGGNRYPTVNTAIKNALETGALVVNYFGHGGEDGLAHERIFGKPDAQELNNVCKLTCFVTVTCEFTKFDNPLRPTAGEYTYWNKDGGAIGLITTTRQIFVNVGITFNTVLEEYLFSYSDNDTYPDDEYPSMAEALRLTKIDPAISIIGQRRLVFFIGDPAMKLAFPGPDIVLTKVNDAPITGTTDVLQALSKVKLSGEVLDLSGNVMTDYNGILSTTIYDKKIERQTLGNDRTRDGGQIIIMDFETLGPIIFRGQSSVTNGQFDIEFVVPKDIGIPVDFGRVSFYAKKEGIHVDHTGASVDQIQIGGLNADAPEDNIGPVIAAYMNDESFVSGGITNRSPSLLVKLEDENGINTASGIGHDIVGILDGDEANPYVLNDYYQTELDDYQRGIVNYPLRDLEPGLHTLSIKAWDVYNNSSTTEIQFVVFDENQQLIIENVLNYPNPFVNYTEFWFNHNSSEPLDVLVQIFTVTGKIVRTLSGQTNSGECCNNGASSLSREIIWDGRDDFGDKIGKGVYIYKLTVRSPGLNKTVEKIEKLVIL
ncbi:type IX secretion system sortase PorU [Xanthomarina sp. F2636L]|uniref:type IX secretion system sortase PorU n=1 Tax=Xanthomarina sp. F2636L TaxID=2996018 RepID=UPI00225DDC36|nr:type IX secretion system sortase PorU [Xanthomarina sp. F2636L]MCX7551919.1 type IX secretion system sortase PorU [Xanthomarina sp. F2636L]